MTQNTLTLDDLKALVGGEIGVSSWMLIDQARVDAFAACTGDQQWIHVDPERASRESPFGGTVAHGFLTLALSAPAGFEMLIARLAGLKQAVNAGLASLRFIAPVRTGQRIRVRMTLESLEEKKPGMFLATSATQIEIENEEKPALTAQAQFMLFY